MAERKETILSIREGPNLILEQKAKDAFSNSYFYEYDKKFSESYAQKRDEKFGDKTVYEVFNSAEDLGALMEAIRGTDLNVHRIRAFWIKFHAPAEEELHLPDWGLAQQFSARYRGDVHLELLHYVNECYDKWTNKKNKNNEKWHSPYVPVVQSSGYGKSRACKEIALTSEPVCDGNNEEEKTWLPFFICTRDKNYQGYPKGNSYARHFLRHLTLWGRGRSIQMMKKWIQGLIFCRLIFRQKYLKAKTAAAAATTTTQRQSKGNVNDGKLAMERLKDSLNQLRTKGFNALDDKIVPMAATKGQDEAERLEFWQYFSEDVQIGSELMNEIWNLIEGRSDSIDLISDEQFQHFVGCHTVLLVFDEASYLVNHRLDRNQDYTIFRLFRDAIKTFPSGLFAIVVDTDPNIAKFSPLSAQDPSHQYTESKESLGSLFHPFTAITTTDVLCPDDFDPDEPDHRFALGRPLWQLVELDQRVYFAHRKIFGGSPDSNDMGKLACGAILTGFKISPALSTASTLVALHMATCMAIDDKRDAILVMYPVEPVLAEAAKCFFWAAYTEHKLDDFFEPLYQCFRLGATDRSYIGEFVSKILLLLGQFQVTPPLTLFSGCKMMLTELFGNNLSTGVGLESLDDNDEFSFNCFVELEGDPEKLALVDPEDTLQKFFDRGSAIQLPQGDCGTDLLLPIRRKQNREDGQQDFVFRYLLIQVHNREDNMAQENLEDTFKQYDLVNWIACGIGFSIVLNVGQPNEESQWYSTAKSNRNRKKRSAKQPGTEPVPTFVVSGVGPTCYPKIFANYSSLKDLFCHMVQERSAFDWFIENDYENKKKDGMVKLGQWELVRKKK